jgi:hypothetical protein
MLDTGCKFTVYSLQFTVYRILDTRYWMIDTGLARSSFSEGGMLSSR